MATRWLIALLLIATITQAQSGDGEEDHEHKILCTSHINPVSYNSLTCTVEKIDGENDNEVEEIFNLTICFRNSNTPECFTEPGNHVMSKKLDNLFTIYNVTFQLTGGGTINRLIDLRKIIRPESPWVVNATFLQKSNCAEIHIGNRYQKDYLQSDKQLFELHLWSEGHTLDFNITSGPLFIEGEYLRKDAEYHVKVRAIPTGGYFVGYWSDWSAPLSFTTHSVPTAPGLKVQPVMYVLFVVIPVLLLIFVCHWKEMIHSYIWPGIPHPKHNVVPIYRPCKGPVMTFKPEVLCFQSIQQGEELFPATRTGDEHGDIVEVKGQYNIQESHSQESDCNCSTEESESILLSGGSPADSRASSLGILELPNGPTEESPPEIHGCKQKGKDEAYVTMSSFYQIKCN